MDLDRLLKWGAVVAIVVIAHQYGLPWLKRHQLKSSASASALTPCASAAEAATNRWGEGLGRFVNPPYDLAEWSGFRSGVIEEIARAERACACEKESCRKARTAMSQLRELSGGLDAAIRNGTSPPDDAVRQQAAIDDQITEARLLESEGK